MSKQEPQQYDSALKSLLGDEIAEILPNLLSEAEYVGEQNIEIDRTTLKADLVYNIKYNRLPHILNMKQIMEGKLHTYDSLLNQDPYIQEQKALERALGRMEGEVQAMRYVIVEITKHRFPLLTATVQHHVQNIQQIETLKDLAIQLSTAPDQASARRLLRNVQD